MLTELYAVLMLLVYLIAQQDIINELLMATLPNCFSNQDGSVAIRSYEQCTFNCGMLGTITCTV